MDLPDSDHNPEPVRPTIRNGVEAVVLPYNEGLNILAAALDLSARQLAQSGITRENMAGGGAKSVLPIVLARTIATVDTIHAALSIGRVEQAEILNRTLMDLEMDAFLLIGDERALPYFADWATVEQSRMALELGSEISLTGRDLDARHTELATKMLDRLAELGLSEQLDDFGGITAEQIETCDLETVLPAFCRVRYGSTRPPSWRAGFTRAEGLDRDGLHDVLAMAASDTMIGSSMPVAIRQAFETLYRQELNKVYGHRSGEVHNSPLTLNRLVDPGSWDIRIAGDITRLPLALLGGFQHLHRATILFLTSWIEQADVSEWSALMNALDSWGDELVPLPTSQLAQ